MLENRADSHLSGARFVGQPAGLPELLPKKTTPPTWLNFTTNLIFGNDQKMLTYKHAGDSKTKIQTNQNATFGKFDNT